MNHNKCREFSISRTGSSLATASYFYSLILNKQVLLFMLIFFFFKVVKSHAGLQEPHFILMGVITLLISSRINITKYKGTPQSILPNFMANTTNVNKYEAL